MSDQFDQSVSMWIRDLKQGDESAAVQLWDRYFERLVCRTSGRLMASVLWLA